MAAQKTYSTQNRILLGTLLVLFSAALLVGGWAIPFQYESFSILYKFGKLKAYLRYGKVIGITTALLFFFQVVLASRPKFLEQVFSMKGVFFLHRLNGIIITFVVAVHPVLIKASENFIPYTFGKKYYPEFVGIGLIFVLLTLCITAIFRNFFKMPHKRWLLLHRLLATMVLFILPVHVLYVSDTFKSGVPFAGAVTIFSLNIIFIVYIWGKRLFQ